MVLSLDTCGFFGNDKPKITKSDHPYDNLVCKFLAAILLHASNQPMIELIMKWLKYIKYHLEKFVDINIVINVTYMKLSVYVLCEIVNLMYLAQ